MHPIKHYMLDFFCPVSITMGELKILDKVYAALEERDALPTADRVYIPSSTVVYARRAILDKVGVDVPLKKLETMLREEGLLTAAEYGIPRWYREKYSMY